MKTSNPSEDRRRANGRGPRSPGFLSLAFTAVVMLLISACGIGQEADESSTVPTVTLPDSPDTSSPVAEEGEPSEDTFSIEAGPLEPGVYETVNFQPTLRFRLEDDSWAGSPLDGPADCEADGCAFGLAYLGEGFDQIHFPLVSFLSGGISWIDPTQPFGTAQPLEPSPDPYEFFLESTHLEVMNEGTMTVSGIEARWLEGTVISAPEGSETFDEAEGARWHNHVVAGHSGWFPVGESVRVIVVDRPDTPLIVFIESATDDLAKVVALTEQVLSTMEIQS